MQNQIPKNWQLKVNRVTDEIARGKEEIEGALEEAKRKVEEMIKKGGENEKFN